VAVPCFVAVSAILTAVIFTCRCAALPHHHLHCESKNWDNVGIRKKWIITRMKNFPPLFNFVATLPCKTNNSVNSNLYHNTVILSKIEAKHDKKGDKKLTKSRQSISSKTMFEVSSLRTSQLFKAAPNFNQPLLQFVDGVDFPLVYTTLHDGTDLVINWIEIWTVWRPRIWRNEVWCFSTQNLHIFTRTFTLVLVLQGNVATELSYSGKFFILGMSSFFLIPTLKEF